MLDMTNYWNVEPAAEELVEAMTTDEVMVEVTFTADGKAETTTEWFTEAEIERGELAEWLNPADWEGCENLTVTYWEVLEDGEVGRQLHL